LSIPFNSIKDFLLELDSLKAIKKKRISMEENGLKISLNTLGI